MRADTGGRSHGLFHEEPKLDPRAENTKKGNLARSQIPFGIDMVPKAGLEYPRISFYLRDGGIGIRMML